jgi:hypothetical protein
MQELMPTQLWLRPRMQSCDQYGRILFVSGVVSQKSQQRSTPFLVRCASELRGALVEGGHSVKRLYWLSAVSDRSVF